MLCPKIVSIKPLEGYKVKLDYETGEVKLFDVLPYMSGEWYGELYNYDYFKSVHLVSSGYGIEWGNGQDIAPHELYDMSIAVGC
ncbi:MAG: DUF2442 domain-containing protein [Chitinivibrionia bacterium]|nr:DUF2442 domain-containing protein [Chitinivibrionia bacterium]